MTLHHWPYVLAMALSAVLALGMAAYALQRRGAPGAAIFTSMMIMVAFWSIAYAMEMLEIEPASKIAWSKRAYLAIANMPQLWLLFALRFGRWRTRFKGAAILWLWLVPTLVLGLVFTNEHHGLIWSTITPVPEPNATMLVYQKGIALWAWGSYAYLLMLAGTILLIWTAITSSQLHRRHILVVLVGAMIPWAGNILYFSRIEPFALVDITPAAFALSGLSFVVGIFRFNFLDLLPVARNIIIEGMRDGVVVLDAMERVIDINPAARSLLNLHAKDPMGKPALEILPLSSTVEAQLKQHPEGSIEIQLTPQDPREEHHPRWLEIHITPIAQSGRQAQGWLVMLRDSTSRKQVEADLRKFLHAVEASPIAIVITDLEGKIEYINPHFTRVTGYSVEEALGQNPRILQSGLTPPETFRQLWTNIRAGKQWRGIFINRKKNGEIFWEEAVIGPVVDARGSTSHYIALKEDITERVRAENAEREQRALAEALRDTAEALNSTLNLEEVFDRILANIERVVPYDASNIILIQDGKAHLVRHRGLLQKEVQQVETEWLPIFMGLLDYQHIMESHQPAVISDTRQDPAWVPMSEMTWMLSKVTVPILVDEQIIGFLNLYSRAAGFYQPEHASRLQAFANQASIAIRNARLFAEVERLATVDALTGLYNRRGLFELGRREIQRVQRFKRPLSILFIDIDHFKQFNDLYSYAVGDQMLQAVANCLRQNVRDVDLVARYGGEEIVVLLPELEPEGCLEVAERLRATIEKMRVPTVHGDLSVTVSIGPATFFPQFGRTQQLAGKEVENLSALIEQAGHMVHLAKAAGRNRVARPD